jgi:Lar family restriction alleviation protein
MNKLESCPFCGGKAEIKTVSNISTCYEVGFDFNIRCTKCGIKLPKKYEIRFKLDKGEVIVTTDEREKAINTWNMRTNNESELSENSKERIKNELRTN